MLIKKLGKFISKIVGVESTFLSLTENSLQEIKDIESYFDEIYYKKTYNIKNNDKYHSIHHYLTVGWKEGKNPSTTFSTTYYLQRHIDVARTEVCPLLHYVRIGEKEGRCIRAQRPPDIEPANKTLTNELKIAIVLHVYYLDMLDSMFLYIKNVPISTHIFITTEQKNTNKIRDFFSRTEYHFDIIECENDGYDILPFLKTIATLKEQKYDLVCKVHTKKGNSTINEADHTWEELLIKPIIGNQDTAQKIIGIFNKNPDIGMIGGADIYKSTKFLMHNNEKYIDELMHQFNHQMDKNDFGFFAGTMFWSRVAVLEPILDLIPIIKKYEKSNQPSSTRESSSIWHALERFFGWLPTYTNYKKALSFACDLDRSNYKVEIESNKNLITKPKILGIGMTLQSELNLKRDIRIISDHNDFDEVFYLASLGYTANELPNPLAHYLRYGFFAGLAPSAHFSPFPYLGSNPDVLTSHANPLTHYIEYGRKEGRACYPMESNVMQISELISKSDLFDIDHYIYQRPDVLPEDAIFHYITQGWLENLNPSQRFYTFWYRNKYMSSRYLSHTNPLVHYLLYGRKQGAKALPGRSVRTKSA